MTDSILIIGGGLAGLTVAQECAAAGARAIVVERDAIVGGRVAAALTAKSSTGDTIDGIAVPKLAALTSQENIEIMTLAEIQDIDGRPGNFDVTIRERARFVTDACTRCNHCKPVCPVVRPNEHDAGLSYRKAIYTPLPETLPQEFVIDIDSCLNAPPNYLPCNRCTEVCDDDAISFDVALERAHRRQVGAIVITTGLEVLPGSTARERGYGSHPDVVTTAELERLLTAPGPTGGFAAKPSNEQYVNSIALVLDEVSPQALSLVASQVNRLAAQDVSRITMLLTSLPGTKELAELRRNLPEGLEINHGLLQNVEPRADNRITLKYADLRSSRLPEEQYDMVVLGADIKPAIGLDKLAGLLDCSLDDAGFVVTTDDEFAGATTCPGVFAAGGATGLMLPGKVIAAAKAVAAAALTHLDPRLLGTTQADDTGTPDPGAPATVSTEELQSRIAHALHNLLENNR